VTKAEGTPTSEERPSGQRRRGNKKESAGKKDPPSAIDAKWNNALMRICKGWVGLLNPSVAVEKKERHALFRSGCLARQAGGR